MAAYYPQPIQPPSRSYDAHSPGLTSQDLFTHSSQPQHHQGSFASSPGSALAVSPAADSQYFDVRSVSPLLRSGPSSPYPPIERRSFRDSSVELDYSPDPFSLSASNSSNQNSGAVSRGRNTPTVGTIGDGRKASSSSNSPEKSNDWASQSHGTGGIFDGRGPLVRAGSANSDSRPPSRPSSFILDVLPARNSPLSSSPPRDAPSSLLFQGSHLAPNSRASSPVPMQASAASDDSSARITRLEASVADLTSLVHHELRSLKDQVAQLKGISPVSSTFPIHPSRLGAESPMLTIRSPSPHSSPAFPSRALPQSSNLSQSQNSDVRDERDEQLRLLTAQVHSLSATLAQLVTSSGNGIVAPSPSPSPLLSQHPHLHPARQLSLPVMGGIQSPIINSSSPGIGGLADWKAPGANGLGVSTAPRSPLLGPGSSSGAGGALSRHSSTGSGYGRNTALSTSASSERNGFGIASPNPLRADANFDSASIASWDAPNAMPSPLAGLVGSSISGNTPNSLGGKWENLGIGNDLFRSIAKYGLGPPTKIQCKAIPCVLRNQDIVSQAPSIQERIQSYVVPAIQLVLSGLAQASLDGVSSPIPKGIQVLIITATVDQSAQAQRLSVGLGGALGIRTSLCVGQGDAQQDVHTFAKSPPHVLVGTPQRLLDLFALRQLPVGEIRLLVIDECDQLIARNLAEHVANLVKLLPPSGGGPGAPPASPGLGGQIRSPLPGAFGGGGDMTPKFADSPRFGGSLTPTLGGPASSSVTNGSLNTLVGPSERQTVIYSCTVPQDVLNFASSLLLREPVRVLVRREGGDSSSPSVRGCKAYYLYIAVGSVVGSGGATKGNANKSGSVLSRDTREWKLEALADLCEDYAFENCVIFCSSVDAVEAVSYKLGTRGIEALALHQDMGQASRQSIMNRFRAAPQNRLGPHKRALVVYDALCRTLTDVSQVPLAINFDLPRAVEDYIHRIACVTASGPGRGSGVVINFVTPGSDVERLRAIESFYRVKIAELPSITAA